MISIIYKEKNNFKDFFKDLVKEFLSFIIILGIFLIQGLLVYLTNPNSASGNHIFVGLTALSGMFLFLFFQNIFKIKKWSRFRLILDSLLMIVSITTDISLPLSTLTILSIIFYIFENKIIKFICGIIQVLIMSLLFSFSIQILMQYTTRFDDLIGNLIIFIVYFIFSYHVSVSPLEFNEINDDINLLAIIKDSFKGEKKNEEKDYLNYNINNENNNEIENENKSSDSLCRKICKKQLIIVYLMIIYILYPIILLIILFLKQYPYSKNYTIRGRFFNIFRENQNYSSMIFATNNGYNYAKKYIKKTNYDFKEEKDISNIIKLGFNEKGFIVNSTDRYLGIFNEKCKNISIPNNNFYEVKYLGENSNGKLFDFQFNFNISNMSCIDLVYIYIRCKECVKKINGNNFNDTKNDNPFHDILLRVGKNEIINDDLPNFIINTNFTLDTKSFNYTILLNTMQITKDYYKFLDSFGEASCNSKAQYTSDTIFIYDGNFPNEI